jgi:hypothetical protein
MPYLINESRALRKKLEGLTVTDATSPSSGREVPVDFVDVEYELHDLLLPGIFVTYGPVTRATDREMRGPILLPYAPEGFTGNILVPEDMEDPDNENLVPWMVTEESERDLAASPYYVPDSPIPFNVDFNVAVLTRNYQHAFQIQVALAQLQYLPERFGYLEVPEDGTVRTLELTGGPETAVSEDRDGKRLLQTLYSVRVASELNLYEVQQISRVATVDLTMDEDFIPVP